MASAAALVQKNTVAIIAFATLRVRVFIDSFLFGLLGVPRAGLIAGAFAARNFIPDTDVRRIFSAAGAEHA